MDDDPPTFEKTYPRYEFSELVRIGIAVGTSIIQMLRRVKAPRQATMRDGDGRSALYRRSRSPRLGS